MLRLALPIIAALGLALPLSAQEKDPSLFYRAFYQESALGDFAAAGRLYAEFLAGATATEDTALRVRALLGSARCAQALGRTAEAQAAFGRALALDPGNEEARRAVAALDSPAVDDDLQAHIQKSITRLAGAEREQATKDLLVYGAKSVPALAAGLRSPDAGVVDLCAQVLVILCARGEEAALEEYARALVDPGVLLRGPLITRLGAPSASLGRMRIIWGRVPSIPEEDLRLQALDYFIRKLSEWAQNGMLSPDTDEDVLLRLLSEISDHSSPGTRSFLLRGYGIDFRAFTPAHLAVVNELIGRGLSGDDVQLRDSARELVRRYSVFYEAQRDRLLGIAMDPEKALGEGDIGWWTSAFFQGTVPTEDLVALLRSPHDALRGESFWTLRARASGDPKSWPTEADRHVVRHVTEWLEGAGNKAAPDQTNSPFQYYFGMCRLEPDELLTIWAAYQRVGHPRVSHQARWKSREYLFEKWFALLPEDGKEAAFRAALAQLDDASLRASLLDALTLGLPTPPFYGTFLATATDPAPEVRSSTYAVLSKRHAVDPDRVRGLALPQLEQDVLAGDWAGGVLLVQTARKELAAGLARALPRGPRDEADLVLGVLVGLDGASVFREEILGRYGRESMSLDPELRLAAFQLLCSFLGEAQGPSGPHWLDLAEVVRGEPALLHELVDQASLGEGTPEDGGRLLRMALEASAGLEDYQVSNLLGYVASYNLDIPIEVVLPFLRHRNGDVREEATKAFDAIRRFEAYRQAAVSFGADARARAIRAIQENAAHADPARRRAAAHGIAALGDPDGVALLFDLLADEDAAVREAAAGALERMGSTATADSAGDEGE